MKTRQKVACGLGLLLLAERAWKLRSIRHFFSRPLPAQKSPVQLVSILQAILSGDPTMPTCLERSLQLKSQYQLEFIWLVDYDDHEGIRICQQLVERYPDRSVQIVLTQPTPPGCNPKAYKLVIGRARAQGEVICVLDDDTLLPAHALEITLPFLDQPGVGLAFGLPYYVNFSNGWSAMVSTFVNSNSLFTYVPYSMLVEPFTINGMFYVMNAATLDSIGGFTAIQQMLADDFAIAHLFRTHGYKLAQTPLLHGISTQVRDGQHYSSLLQRWFVFPRESIMRHVSWRDMLVFYTFGVLPALVPLLLLLALLLRPGWQRLACTLLYFGYDVAAIEILNRDYLQQSTPRNKRWLVPLMLVLIPLQIVQALFSAQRINWRGHIIQVERGGSFRYVERTKTTHLTTKD